MFMALSPSVAPMLSSRAQRGNLAREQNLVVPEHHEAMNPESMNTDDANLAKPVLMGSRFRGNDKGKGVQDKEKACPCCHGQAFPLSEAG
jgi:hypothetical protein